jgi:U3 small nucleolar RNA-associated protein 21
MQLPARIAALACKGDLTFAAVGTTVVVCKRVSCIRVWRGHTAPIIQLLVFGDLLLSLSKSGHLALWKLDLTTNKPVVCPLLASFGLRQC